MSRVKVCGLCRLEDARLAVELGAWAVGFVFHEPSPRCVDPERAREIVRALPPEVLSVGVFVDWPLAKLQSTLERVGLRVAQLHGDESPQYARGVKAEEVWKAFRVRGDFDPAHVEPWAGCDRILLDAWHPERPGGTGRTFDWSLARGLARRRSVILAGGLGPENAAEALRAVDPWAIDVSSGVEEAPGVKSEPMLRELFRVVGEETEGEER